MNIKKIDLRILVALLFFISMTFLIFTRLGYYPLWDDEANTAIFANSVWQTGDTSAIFGNNILGYRGGIELNAVLKNRLVAPLGYYVTAPFLGLLGTDPFSVRLPFAIAGLLTVAFIIFWLFKSKASLKTHVLIAFGFLGNISFILYCKQCRYYALAMLFSVLVCYFYVDKLQSKSFKPNWQTTIFLILSLTLLLSAHYIAYAALTSALLLDFFLWGRHHHSLTRLEYLVIIFSQILSVICIVSIWYPLGKDIAGVQDSNWLWGKLTLLYMFFRDANLSEAVVGLVFFVAPLIYYFQTKPNIILLRLTIGCLVLFIVTSLFSPQAGEVAIFGAVRYLAFALPIFIYLCVITIENCPIKPVYQYLLAIFVFFSTGFNILSAFVIPSSLLPPIRSTFVSYLKELKSPPKIAYSETADWINKHTQAGETAVILPSYHVYPLMYHAPNLIYGWQFSSKSHKPHLIYGWQFNRKIHDKFPHLPAIQYYGKVMPDYFIFFGEDALLREDFIRQIHAKSKFHYVEFAHLSVSTRPRSRPEIFLHTFEEITPSDHDDGVYIFKRI